MKNQTHLPSTRGFDEVGGYLAPVVAAESAEQDGIKLQMVLSTFVRRRRIMVITFVGVLLIAAAFTWASRPVYKSTASILVDAGGNRDDGASQLPLLSDLKELTQARSVDTQTEIIKSPPVQQASLARLSVEDRRVLGELPDVDVKSIKGTDIIMVSTFSHSPKAAAALSNAICDQYITANRLGNREQTHAAADYVVKQMQSVRVDLDKAQGALKAFKEQNMTVDLTQEAQQRILQLSQIETELRQSRTERAAAAAQFSSLSRQLAGMAPTQVVATTVAPTPVVDEIKSQLTKLEMDRTAMLQEYTPTSPEVKRLDTQIAGLRHELQSQARTEVRGTQTAANPVRQAIAEEAARAQGQIWALDARGKALVSAVAKVRADLTQLPEREFRLAELSTETNVIQQTYSMLNQEYQRLRISEEARLANARVVAPAMPPKDPISPRKGLNMALAMAVGLMLAAGLAALVDRMDDRVHSEEDAETAAARPVLSHVPFIKTEDERCLIADTRRNSPLLESFRMLRSNISLSLVDESLRSVVVTSSEPSEGKTHTCCNLAIAMALDGKKVILVEGDLRRPSTHTLFKLSNEIGVTNVVAGNKTLSEALQETGVPGLRLLASGPLPPNPPELLNSRANRAVFQQILDEADFVVVDSPPGLVMADAQVISSMTDGAILVVSAGQSHKHLVSKVSAMLGATGAKMLGIVINKLESDPGGYYSYYGYYHYNSYQKYHTYYGSRELATTESENSDSTAGVAS